jgi:hypothetical protein
MTVDLFELIIIFVQDPVLLSSEEINKERVQNRGISSWKDLIFVIGLEMKN